MTCIVNGEPMELEENTTVSVLIESLGLAGSICAAEIDRVLVPKSEHAQRVLRKGEAIEIVSLVGGG